MKWRFTGSFSVGPTQASSVARAIARRFCASSLNGGVFGCASLFQSAGARRQIDCVSLRVKERVKGAAGEFR